MPMRAARWNLHRWVAIDGTGTVRARIEGTQIESLARYAADYEFPDSRLKLIQWNDATKEQREKAAEAQCITWGEFMIPLADRPGLKKTAAAGGVR